MKHAIAGLSLSLALSYLVACQKVPETKPLVKQGNSEANPVVPTQTPPVVNPKTPDPVIVEKKVVVTKVIDSAKSLELMQTFIHLSTCGLFGIYDKPVNISINDKLVIKGGDLCGEIPFATYLDFVEYKVSKEEKKKVNDEAEAKLSAMENEFLELVKASTCEKEVSVEAMFPEIIAAVAKWDELSPDDSLLAIYPMRDSEPYKSLLAKLPKTVTAEEVISRLSCLGKVKSEVADLTQLKAERAKIAAQELIIEEELIED